MAGRRNSFRSCHYATQFKIPSPRSASHPANRDKYDITWTRPVAMSLGFCSLTFVRCACFRFVFVICFCRGFGGGRCRNWTGLRVCFVRSKMKTNKFMGLVAILYNIEYLAALVCIVDGVSLQIARAIRFLPEFWLTLETSHIYIEIHISMIIKLNRHILPTDTWHFSGVTLASVSPNQALNFKSKG